MKSFLLKVFTWWNSQTFGTQFWTWLYGEFVGEDEFGNRYYRTRGGKIDPTLGFERRWVIYNGYTEASTIPPSWHGWMHHTVDTPPTEISYTAAAVAEAAPAEHDRHAGQLPPARLDAGAEPPSQGHRRLQGLDSGALSGAVRPPFPRRIRRVNRAPPGRRPFGPPPAGAKQPGSMARRILIACSLVLTLAARRSSPRRRGAIRPDLPRRAAAPAGQCAERTAGAAPTSRRRSRCRRR